jgi:hypothetical protein
MKSIVALLICGLVAGIAHARPTVVEESAVLTRPDSSWQYFGRFGVAVDGDYALVSGERYVPDPAAEGGQRHEATTFVYRRASATSWTYVGRLGPIVTIANLHPGLAMKDGVAITITERYRIWQRSGDTFTLEPVAGLEPTSLNGSDIEMEGGRILTHCGGCQDNFAIMRKVNGTWLNENGPVVPGDHISGTPDLSMDIHGDLMLISAASGIVQDYALHAYRRNASSRWEPVPTPFAAPGDFPQPALALSGSHYAYAQDRHWGSMVISDHGSGPLYAGSRFRPADLSMQPELRSGSAMERVGDLIAQRNFRYDTGGHAWHLFRINEDANHTQTEVAMLQPRDGTFLGNRLDATAGRVIVNNWDENGGNNAVRVFELPTPLEAPPVEVHDFEPPTSAAAWQPSAGSSFFVAKVGLNHVYRQPSTAGAPASFLQTSTGNQAIETDVTLRTFSGSDRWIGLATRRSDVANYYYVTFRTSGTIELKRMQDGVLTTIDAAPATLLIGRPYKLRLESIGSLHRVYLDNRLVLSARDRALSEGVAGILMNRAAADWDNVTVTPNPFTTILADDFSAPNDLWFYKGGTLQPGGYLTMPALSNRGESYGGARPEHQVVRARIRPVSFNAPENWVGIAGRYSDSRNHIYVSLHGRHVIALWKRTDGVISQLTTARLTVTPGTWYDVRLETVAGSTRVYVNGQQVLSSNADLGPLAPSLGGGGVAITTYRASADYDDFFAYRP